MNTDTDILIIGAGACGLSAAVSLEKHGKKVLVVEARDRIGGRILTIKGSGRDEKIDLGADFVHGLPPALLEFINPQIDFLERADSNLIFKDNKLELSSSFDNNSTIIDQLVSETLDKDMSFQKWVNLKDRGHSDQVRSIMDYIQGYHAADLDEISTKVLHDIETDNRKEQAVEDSFFLKAGLNELISRLRSKYSGDILLNYCAKTIHWSKEGVSVSFINPHAPSLELKPIRAKKLIITVPIGVLQSVDKVGSLQFQPSLPGSISKKLSFFKMGSAIKISYAFYDYFWEKIGIDDFFFLFDPTPNVQFPIWWKKGRTLNAWRGGPLASSIKCSQEKERVDIAVRELARLFNKPGEFIRQGLETSYVHDWETDSFSLGAYAYVKVGGKQAQEQYSEPVDQVLFFAGDIGTPGAFCSTVNGAFLSGIHVAEKLCSVLCTPCS